MIFAGKQKQIQSQLDHYCQTVIECMQIFTRALAQHCENPDSDTTKQSFHEIHKAESQADDIRRDIEVLMYSKALFPESRGDILGLLESADKVPNQAESAIQTIKDQNITIPPRLSPDILRLADICVRCVNAMIESMEKLFTDYTSATVAVGKIDELETAADNIEAELIQQIFADEPTGPADSMNKILLRDLVRQIASICDRAENVGDRIRIIVAKRGV